MNHQRLYRELAVYYDYIYDFKDYKKESVKVLKLIQTYKKSSGKTLLEAGCGTGRYLDLLKKKFDCTGIDFNKEILRIARKKCKGVTLIQADMAHFDLGKKFDVIVCLFSSIGYVKTYARLKKTIQSFSNHLKKGGVLIIEPWMTREEYRVGSTHLQTYKGKDIKIARANVSARKGNISILQFHYLIAKTGQPVRHYYDEHELGLFSRKKTLQFMKEAGLKTKYQRDGLMPDRRGLYIGVKE